MAISAAVGGRGISRTWDDVAEPLMPASVAATWSASRAVQTASSDASISVDRKSDASVPGFAGGRDRDVVLMLRPCPLVLIAATNTRALKEPCASEPSSSCAVGGGGSAPPVPGGGNDIGVGIGSMDENGPIDRGGKGGGEPSGTYAGGIANGADAFNTSLTGAVRGTM